MHDICSCADTSVCAGFRTCYPVDLTPKGARRSSSAMKILDLWCIWRSFCTKPADGFVQGVFVFLGLV